MIFPFQQDYKYKKENNIKKQIPNYLKAFK